MERKENLNHEFIKGFGNKFNEMKTNNKIAQRNVP